MWQPAVAPRVGCMVAQVQRVSGSKAALESGRMFLVHHDVTRTYTSIESMVVVFFGGNVRILLNLR